ncbi:MAG TPA: hypothetical protein VIW24_23950 [Aldersonia sp.]
MNTDEHRRAALDRLPLPYSEALRLRDAGVADRVIAEILGIEPEAIGTLIRVAEAKLAAARSRDRR